jgi:hypothetical protein
VFQIEDFSSGYDLKFTYVHLQFQFFPGLYPTPIIKGREEEEGRERKRGDGMNPSKTNHVCDPVCSQFSHFS